MVFSKPEENTHEGNGKMFAAIDSGDISALEQAVNTGADVNTADIEGETALMRASLKGFAEGVKILLNEGAEVNSRNIYGKTALFYSISHGVKGTETMTLLLECGADPNARDKNGITPLMFCCGRGNPDFIPVLVSCGADPRITDNDGKTALDYTQKKYGERNIAHFACLSYMCGLTPEQAESILEDKASEISFLEENGAMAIVAYAAAYPHAHDRYRFRSLHEFNSSVRKLMEIDGLMVFPDRFVSAVIEMMPDTGSPDDYPAFSMGNRETERMVRIMNEAFEDCPEKVMELAERGLGGMDELKRRNIRGAEELISGIAGKIHRENMDGQLFDCPLM